MSDLVVYGTRLLPLQLLGYVLDIEAENSGSRPGGDRRSGLENFSVMDERKGDIDRKIKGNI